MGGDQEPIATTLNNNRMKAIIIFFILLTTYSCNEVSSTCKEKQSCDSLNIHPTLNDSLKRQILYHGDCTYSLSETEGWIANGEPPQKSDHIRILVLYEPKRGIQHSAPMGIYSNVIFKDEYIDLTFNKFLKGEKEDALRRGEKVIEAASIKTQDNKTAIIRKYLIERIGEFYAIAYIDEPKYVIMITFTTKDLNDYNNQYQSFVNIVKSYKYLGITVIDTTRK